MVNKQILAKSKYFFTNILIMQYVFPLILKHTFYIKKSFVYYNTKCNVNKKYHGNKASRFYPLIKFFFRYTFHIIIFILT